MGWWNSLLPLIINNQEPWANFLCSSKKIWRAYAVEQKMV
jgi:hypothetical protein